MYEYTEQTIYTLNRLYINGFVFVNHIQGDFCCMFKLSKYFFSSASRNFYRCLEDAFHGACNLGPRISRLVTERYKNYVAVASHPVCQ